ncbi:hypothetical protein AB0M20_19205 [Actinoplanes sp. NPDC051633]|uniref:hypothetical protein n=1 Tax=Actinoplanes sp. NPDC051633 TaxID=3155670 RepID=UPI003443040F
MIVVALLLILVAVALLVLGLAAGSSIMLIGSIVASLLAAVVLVIGARQAATRRRATTAGADPGVPATPEDDPFLAEGQSPAEFATAGARRAPAEGPGVAGTHTAQGSRAAESARRPPGDFPPPPPASPAPAEDFDDLPPPGHPVSPPDDLPPPPGRAADDFPPPPGRAADDDDDDLDAADEERYARETDDYASPADEARADFSGSDPILDGRDAGAPDYDRASSVIGAARSGSDESWRRPGEEPLLLDEDDDDENASAPASRRDKPGESGAARVPADEDFAEPDEDDPEDEPLPQAVRPGDAVRVARMDDEVMVVDGRPRYHMPDCHHLAGRLTEPIPVGEAIELGFNPCGLCRPVDRLVAQHARP